MNDDKEKTQPEKALDKLSARIAEDQEKLREMARTMGAFAKLVRWRDLVSLVQLGVVIVLIVADIIIRVVVK